MAQRRLAELVLLAISIAWAGNFVAIKAAVAVMPPVTVSFIRFGVAGLILLAILRWREGSVGLPRRDALAVAALGALGFGLYQVLWATALVWTSAGDSALIIASSPIWTALIAVAARTDTLTPAKLGGALVAFGGVGSSSGARVPAAAAGRSWAGS